MEAKDVFTLLRTAFLADTKICPLSCVIICEICDSTRDRRSAASFQKSRLNHRSYV